MCREHGCVDMRRALAALSLIVALAACGQSTRPAASLSPTAVASAAPTPLSRPLNVAASTPVILYHDPADFDQVDGVTWDGKISGKIGSGVTNGGNASPDGRTYATSLDRDFFNFWADDSSHYC